MRTLVALIALPLLPLAASPPAEEKPRPQPACVVVFDFQSPGLDETGKQLARSVFGKLKRQQDSAGNEGKLVIVDPLTAAEATEHYQVNYDASAARVGAVLAGELAANVAVVGTLSRTGADYTAKVRLLDLRAGGDDWLWEKTFAATGQRARGLLADQITEAVSGIPVAKPLEVGYDPEPARLGPTVSANGGFETGADGVPADWRGIDNLTAFWADDPAGRRGKILRINTDVKESQWKAWTAKLAAGAPLSAAPKPEPTRPPKYDTVAGAYGVHVYSADIPAKPGMRYRVLADFKGAGGGFFFPKIFVKGYAPVAAPDEPQKTQDREVWRTYLALRNSSGDWQHYSQTLRPAAGVKFLRVIVYAYWPPGVYEFDNVRLVEEPAPATQPDRK